jgi:hypothetical protein
MSGSASARTVSFENRERSTSPVCGSMATPVFAESGNAVFRVAHAGISADQHKPLIFRRCMMSRARTPARNNLGTKQNGDFLQRRRPPSKIQQLARRANLTPRGLGLHDPLGLRDRSFASPTTKRDFDFGIADVDTEPIASPARTPLCALRPRPAALVETVAAPVRWQRLSSPHHRGEHGEPHEAVHHPLYHIRRGDTSDCG